MASDKRSYMWVNKEEAEAILKTFVDVAENSGKFEEIEQAVRLVKMAKDAIDDLEEREAEENGK